MEPPDEQSTANQQLLFSREPAIIMKQTHGYTAENNNAFLNN